MRREAHPLHKKRQAKFIGAAQNSSRADKRMAGLLGIGTGARPDTICHTTANWFAYSDDGRLFYNIPNSSPCEKGGDTRPCGDCRNLDHERYSPKTPRGEGRSILIPNHWTNHETGQEEYFGLRDFVESYFSIEDPNAPSDASSTLEYGHHMINGDGISKGTYTNWVRDIAYESTIQPHFRRNCSPLDPQDPDSPVSPTRYDGLVPDVFGHDLRACYATQLMRNEIELEKATVKTGHKNAETLYKYVKFAQSEIDSDEEEDFF